MVISVFITIGATIYYIKCYSFLQWGYHQFCFLLQTWYIIFLSVVVFIALLFSELLCSLGTMPPLLPHAYKFKYFFSSRNSKVGGPFLIPTSDKTFSSHGPTLPSSPHLFFSCTFDPSNADHIEDVPMPLNGFSPSAKDDKPIQPKVGIKKKNYDAIKKFKEKWVAQLPWVELFIREDGTLHIVKCRVCTKVERKKYIFTTKWDSFCKHASC
jgi:hypothetical protein